MTRPSRSHTNNTTRLVDDLVADLGATRRCSENAGSGIERMAPMGSVGVF
jgi:hypothetical protein